MSEVMNASMLDVFNGSAFTLTSLTDMVNQIVFKPQFLRSLNLFNSTSVATTSIGIEEKGGILSLVAPTPRGAPGVTIDKVKRKMRNLTIPHFETPGAVMAEEVQGVRRLGSTSETETVMEKLAEHAGNVVSNFDATTEYSQMGAVKGIVTYADGSTLNLFTEFGVSAPAEIGWDIINSTNGALRKKCMQLVRQVAGILDGIPFTSLLVLCSDQFFDDLLQNAEVRATYLNATQARELAQAYIGPGANGAFGVYVFGDITFVNYRGTVNGVKFIADDKAHVVPLGVRNLFRTVYAPADYVETVNTLGTRLVAKQYPMDNGKGVNFDIQMNELNFCQRPGVLIPLRRGV